MEFEMHHWCQRRRVMLVMCEQLSWRDAYFRARLEWAFMQGFLALVGVK